MAAPPAGMVPIALNVAALPVAVAGAGDAALRRVNALHAAGARRLTYFCADPTLEPHRLACVHVERRLPTRPDLD